MSLQSRLSTLISAIGADVKALDTAIDNVIVKVNHGSNGSTARPAGAYLVYWIGTATPTNAQADDLWVNK